MFENKKINIALAIVVATLLWAYVIGSINPPAEKKLKDVPITLTNTEVLESNGLAVKECSAETIDLVLSGSRSDISKLRTDEVSAVVDISNAVEGENELSVDIHIPESIDISQKSISKLVVTVEKIETKTVDVQIVYSGETDDGSEPHTVSVSDEKVLIKGAESLVESVNSARGTVDITKVTENETTNPVTLVPVDSEGIMVDNIKITPASVNVVSVLTREKTVKLNVQVTDNSENAGDKSWSAPEEIIIGGKASDLEDIDSIDSVTVDITGVNEDAKIEIVPVLPDGIFLSDKNDSLMLDVKVSNGNEGNEEKTFTVSTSEIALEGGSDALSYSFSQEEVTVTVRGSRDEIEAVSEGDIRLSAEVGDIARGDSRTVEITVTVSGHSSVTAEVNPAAVTVSAS